MQFSHEQRLGEFFLQCTAAPLEELRALLMGTSVVVMTEGQVLLFPTTIHLGNTWYNNSQPYLNIDVFVSRHLKIQQKNGVRSRRQCTLLKQLLGQRKVTDFLSLVLDISSTSLSTCCVCADVTKCFFVADTSLLFPSVYSPEYVEPSWYEWWEKEGFFRPEKHVKNMSDNNFLNNIFMIK